MPEDKKKKKAPPWTPEGGYDFTKKRKPLLEADTSTPEPPKQSDAEETIERLKRRNKELEDLYGEGKGEAKAEDQNEGLNPGSKKKKKKKKKD